MIIELVSAISDRISRSGLVEKVFGLGLIYRLKESTEPVVFENGQPLHIDFDQYKSLCFFLLNGPVNQTQRDSEVSCGVFLSKKIPLRLVYFSSRAEQDICSPIDEQTLQNILSLITFQDDKSLRQQFKLSAVSFQATAQELRPEIVWFQIFGKLNYKLPENQQLISLDFDLNYEGDPVCWTTEPCADDKSLEDENYEPMQSVGGEVINYK